MPIIALLPYYTPTEGSHSCCRTKLRGGQYILSICPLCTVRCSALCFLMRAIAGFNANCRFIQVATCTARQARYFNFTQDQEAFSIGGCAWPFMGNRQLTTLPHTPGIMHPSSPSSVRICGTNVRTFLTGSQSASPWPHTNVPSSMTPCTQHSRSTGRLHGPLGTLNLSL